jgi:hypothetical protein
VAPDDEVEGLAPIEDDEPDEPEALGVVALEPVLEVSAAVPLELEPVPDAPMVLGEEPPAGAVLDPVLAPVPAPVPVPWVPPAPPELLPLAPPAEPPPEAPDDWATA